MRKTSELGITVNFVGNWEYNGWLSLDEWTTIRCGWKVRKSACWRVKLLGWMLMQGGLCCYKDFMVRLKRLARDFYKYLAGWCGWRQALNGSSRTPAQQGAGSSTLDSGETWFCRRTLTCPFSRLQIINLEYFKEDTKYSNTLKPQRHPDLAAHVSPSNGLSKLKEQGQDPPLSQGALQSGACWSRKKRTSEPYSPVWRVSGKLWTSLLSVVKVRAVWYLTKTILSCSSYQGHRCISMQWNLYLFYRIGIWTLLRDSSGMLGSHPHAALSLRGYLKVMEQPTENCLQSTMEDFAGMLMHIPDHHLRLLGDFRALYRHRCIFRKYNIWWRKLEEEIPKHLGAIKYQANLFEY